jgi:hypothetical protein
MGEGTGMWVGVVTAWTRQKWNRGRRKRVDARDGILELIGPASGGFGMHETTWLVRSYRSFPCMGPA